MKVIYTSNNDVRSLECVHNQGVGYSPIYTREFYRRIDEGAANFSCGRLAQVQGRVESCHIGTCSAVSRIDLLIIDTDDFANPEGRQVWHHLTPSAAHTD